MKPVIPVPVQRLYERFDHSEREMDIHFQNVNELHSHRWNRINKFNPCRGMSQNIREKGRKC